MLAPKYASKTIQYGRSGLEPSTNGRQDYGRGSFQKEVDVVGLAVDVRNSTTGFFRQSPYNREEESPSLRGQDMLAKLGTSLSVLSLGLNDDPYAGTEARHAS